MSRSNHKTHYPAEWDYCHQNQVSIRVASADYINWNRVVAGRRPYARANRYPEWTPKRMHGGPGRTWKDPWTGKARARQHTLLRRMIERPDEVVMTPWHRITNLWDAY